MKTSQQILEEIDRRLNLPDTYHENSNAWLALKLLKQFILSEPDKKCEHEWGAFFAVIGGKKYSDPRRCSKCNEVKHADEP